MTVWALLVLATAATVLRDDVNTVPPGEWRYQQFSVGPKLPADVDCTFQVAAPGRARVELMTRDNLQALLKGRSYESIATATSGTLHQEIGVPGDFALVIVNPDQSQSARVAMRITLDTSGQSLIKARFVSPERKLAIILSSFAGFLLIVSVSARKLLLAMKR
jgi:hypothetical protein